LSQTLRASLAQLETNRATLIKQNVGPNAPAIQTLNSQIKATREQILVVEAQVARNEGDPPISEIVSQYELLDLERQFAQTMVTNTMTALDQARANAAAQQVYLISFVRPALPDSSTYPRRFISVLVVAAFSALAWFIYLLIARSVRDYQV
jgi:capsular polysaccharide transport system permease protein